MAKPDVKICPTCESEIYYLTKDNFIVCSSCSTTITVSPSIIEEDPVIEKIPQFTELEQLQIAIAEMAEATEQAKIENQIAIAELAEIVAGGVA